MCAKMSNPSSRFPLDVGTATTEVATQTEEGIAYVNKTDVPARQNCKHLIHSDWNMQLATASCDILRLQLMFKILEVYFLCIKVVAMAFQRNITRFLRKESMMEPSNWSSLWVSPCLWCPTGIPACKGHPVWGFSGDRFVATNLVAKDLLDTYGSELSWYFPVCLSLGREGIQIESDWSRTHLSI